MKSDPMLFWNTDLPLAKRQIHCNSGENVDWLTGRSKSLKHDLCKAESRFSHVVSRASFNPSKKGKWSFCLTTPYRQRTPNYHQVSNVGIEIPVRLFDSFRKALWSSIWLNTGPFPLPWIYFPLQTCWSGYVVLVEQQFLYKTIGWFCAEDPWNYKNKNWLQFFFIVKPPF